MARAREEDARIAQLEQELARVSRRVVALENAVRGGLCAVCQETIGEEDWVMEDGRLVHRDGCQGA
ncbi:MAG: hypothetical protein OEM59_19310 [Rhodospirillales bacterium]|nr:hypothetical protein [Rhodospirillales bacterium]